MIEIAFELGGLAAAVAFGVYAIRAVNDASIANQYGSQAVLVLQALTANQLALLAACLSTGEQVSFEHDQLTHELTCCWYVGRGYRLHLLSLDRCSSHQSRVPPFKL